MNRNYSGQVESQRRVLGGDKRVKRVYEEPGAGESTTCLRGKKKKKPTFQMTCIGSEEGEGDYSGCGHVQGPDHGG